MAVSCRGDLTVATVSERMPELLTALTDDEDAELVLDLSAVDEIDTAGLQLLLLLRREVAARSGRLLLDPVGDPVARLLALAQLDLRLEPRVVTATEGNR